ncbi:hypothetical protein ACFHW1_04985 [Micromonospora sp. LOL_014]|uniref:hypothetical protein n=1 Tax=Micromonospora sp. LOL_014 TaxID=3345415 RepID=UPI003A87F524
MAIVALPYTSLVANGQSADLNNGAGTAFEGDGMRISDAVPERTILRVENASGGAVTVTVSAGDNPPALAAGLGDFTTTSLADNDIAYLGPFESGRFLQADGSMLVTPSAEGDGGGRITALLVPKAQ